MELHHHKNVKIFRINFWNWASKFKLNKSTNVSRLPDTRPGVKTGSYNFDDCCVSRDAILLSDLHISYKGVLPQPDMDRHLKSDCRMSKKNFYNTEFVVLVAYM